MANVNDTRMRKFMTIGGLLLLLLFFIMLFGLNSHNSPTSSLANSYRTNQSSPQTTSRFVSPLEKIEMSARQAMNKEAERKVSGDENSINQLFDSIFEMASVRNSRLPSETEASLKNRLIKSELKFREGKHKTIREYDLAKAFNNLSDNLGLPEYSKTFVAQIRRLRVTIMPQVPTLIGKVNRDPNHAAGRTIGAMITTEMSPAEAILITTFLMQQKLINDLYQTTPKDWANKVREKVDDYQKSRKDQRSNDSSLRVLDNPKTDAISESLSERFNQVNILGVSYISDMITKFLDDLGID